MENKKIVWKCRKCGTQTDEQGASKNCPQCGWSVFWPFEEEDSTAKSSKGHYFSRNPANSNFSSL